MQVDHDTRHTCSLSFFVQVGTQLCPSSLTRRLSTVKFAREFLTVCVIMTIPFHPRLQAETVAVVRDHLLFDKLRVTDPLFFCARYVNA